MRALLRRNLSRSSIALWRSRPSTNSSFLSSRTLAVPASFVDEEAEMVTFPREGLGISYELNWKLNAKGVFVKDKAYHNLKVPELQKFGACKPETLSGLPFYMRNNANGGALDISMLQFSKLLKRVTSHLSSVSSIFVQDGAIGSSPKYDAKVRIISDNPSALLPLSDIIWSTSSQEISRGLCSLTAYVASSISPKTVEDIGLESQSATAFSAGVIGDSSLIFCGNAFADIDFVKVALSTMAAPIISGKRGIPLCTRILVSGDSVILLFAHEDIAKNSPDLHAALVSPDIGAVLVPDGVTPFFRAKDPTMPNVLKEPSAVVFASSDSTGALPSISKLSPEQAAYHYLAGFHDGKFVPGYINSPYLLDPLTVAKDFHERLKTKDTPSFLINVNDGGKFITGSDLLKLVKSSLSKDLTKSQPAANDDKVNDLKEKYKSFLSGRFKELPEEFSF
ncbi:hypothetical protein HPP92_009011 [Vanilla planifolia]|uniref:phosphoenolpyruvate carboxykinase (ATP) n=1 Tax=Vanilla planifolia TaxID=51239 RepID=A0A835RFE3_VANPL|nr:hypothetical protein HPP92_009011 [Vanilla planifolia]